MIASISTILPHRAQAGPVLLEALRQPVGFGHRSHPLVAACHMGDTSHPFGVTKGSIMQAPSGQMTAPPVRALLTAQAVVDRFEIEAQRGAPRRFPAFLAIRSAHVCLSAGSFWNN
jgi:hypothetical protein